MTTRSPSRGRFRSRTRSLTPRSAFSESPDRRRRHASRSSTRSPIEPARRNGRQRSDSRSLSRSRGHGRGDSRDTDDEPAAKSTKIVVERLSKNINEEHLYEIFGHFGHIQDLDLPINRSSGTNRGTAYILFEDEADAEAAIANMHEGQVDGSTINVSIVLHRRKLSPAPPTARRGANIDPRQPFAGSRGFGPPGPSLVGSANAGGGGGRRRHSPPNRYGSRTDVYRPSSRSPSKSPIGGPASRGVGSRYRSRSFDSFTSRSRSRSPPPNRRGATGRYDDYDHRRRGRSRSHDGYSDRSRSPSRSRHRRH